MKNLEYMLDVEQSINPQSSAAATVEGDSVSRQGAHQVMAIVGCGAATGSPTAQSCVFQVQEYDGSTWSDVGDSVDLTTDDDEAVITVPSAYNAESTLRIECTVSFTGGSTPAQLIYGTLVLAELPSEPSSI